MAYGMLNMWFAFTIGIQLFACDSCSFESTEQTVTNTSKGIKPTSMSPLKTSTIALQSPSATLSIMFSATFATLIALIIASGPATALPSPQATPMLPSTVCFPAGDPLAEIMSITAVGTIIGTSGVTACPSGHTCVALTTAEIESVNSALAFDPELEFLVALMRTEEPGVALIGVRPFSILLQRICILMCVSTFY